MLIKRKLSFVTVLTVEHGAVSWKMFIKMQVRILSSRTSVPHWLLHLFFCYLSQHWLLDENLFWSMKSSFVDMHCDWLVRHLLYFLDRNYRASHRPQIEEKEGFHFHHIQRRNQRQEVPGEEIPQHPGWQGTCTRAHTHLRVICDAAEGREG